ncbi:YidC/Oxa1 family membrane protein insertase [Nitriliruptoraceae bacterium ZYF776]|nr:YidC/Oxa1 family membrane protein insertase [Profundirhabdus halotolerans]
MGNFWSNVLDVFENALAGLHSIFEPLTGIHAWGFAIIALTLCVRVLLLPLAIKQIRSMRAMQALQPRIKELQKKYKVDRDLMRKDPEQYRARKQKLNTEMMALYQEEKVNPAASCLPLLLQAPIFFALFRVLQGERAAELTNADFYFFTDFISDDSAAQGLGAVVSAAGWPGWLLIVFMAGTMFITQKQMMARQAAAGADNPMAQQQKILLYVMPGILGLVSLQLPLGVLLYWVTTNLFQAVQQWFMLREVKQEVADGTLGQHKGGESAPSPKAAGGNRRSNPGASSGSGRGDGSRPGGGDRPASDGPGSKGSGSKGSGSKGSGSKGSGAKSSGSKGSGKGAGAPGSNGKGAAGSDGGSSRRKSDHLPRRGDRR